jgi:hypothetical protein
MSLRRGFAAVLNSSRGRPADIAALCCEIIKLAVPHSIEKGSPCFLPESQYGPADVLAMTHADLTVPKASPLDAVSICMAE